MGCFLGCIRIKENGSRRCNLFSKSCSWSWKKRELLGKKNQYASVVSSEGKASPSEKEERENLEEGFDGGDSLYDELKQEAKFLKTCGAILETPIEIRKASVLQSEASDSYCKKINWDQQLDVVDGFPTKAPEPLTSKEVKHKCCQQEENDDTMKMAVTEELKHSVGVKEISSEESELSPQEEYEVQPYGSESPYPTPLNLIDGLQTPGTIYPPKSDNFRSGGIRNQFVFGVPDLSQRAFELRALCEGRENTQNAPLTFLNKHASGCLKSPSTRNETKGIMGFRKEQFHSQNNPDVDKPIVGTAAACWNGEDLSRVSPKQWDGNGIPNSTTKYKEDQKVSWHATPFEMRLEKALSDENVYPQRKLDARLMVLEDEVRG